MTDVEKALAEGRALLERWQAFKSQGFSYMQDCETLRVLVTTLEAVSRQLQETKQKTALSSEQDGNDLLKWDANIVQGAKLWLGATQWSHIRRYFWEQYSPGSAPPQNTAQPSKPKPSMPCAICGERRDLHALPMQCPESMKEWAVVTVFTPPDGSVQSSASHKEGTLPK